MPIDQWDAAVVDAAVVEHDACHAVHDHTNTVAVPRASPIRHDLAVLFRIVLTSQFYYFPNWISATEFWIAPICGCFWNGFCAANCRPVNRTFLDGTLIAGVGENCTVYVN